MLLAFNKIEKLKNFLNKKVKEEEIIDFRISLNLDTSFLIDIVGKESEKLKKELNELSSIRVYIENWIDIEDYKNDSYYQDLFKNKEIDLGYKRRLSNLVNSNSKKKSNKTPIVTFYSYKGGVGRTTALITFANYYAYHYKKKVVILDFDFEAPGITNYFDFSLDDLENKNGVVEYLLDKQALKNNRDLKLIQNYMIQVSKEYSADGSIYIMPAGNLFGDENLDSYIEALARIDINSTDTIIKQIIELIEDINQTINPDVILIDSRTGFNDIFGFLINKISDVIVGLFEENIQTKAGLKLFLKETYNDENDIKSILVNSLVHKNAPYRRKIDNFKRYVHNYIVELTDETYAPNIYNLRNSSILGNLGTIEDEKEDYFDFIKNITPPEYKKFFDKVIELIKPIEKDIISEPKEMPNNSNKLRIIKKNSESTDNIETLKATLLKKVYDNYPKTYAENIDYNDDFLNKKFYFRKPMEDIFNFDKLLLIGTKGTGKTAFYLALRDKRFLDNLKRKANKYQIKFTAINIMVPSKKRWVNLQSNILKPRINQRKVKFSS